MAHWCGFLRHCRTLDHSLQDFVHRFYHDDAFAAERAELKAILRRVWDNTFSDTNVLATDVLPRLR